MIPRPSAADGSHVGVAIHVVEIDESLFPFEVVLKATYWLTGRFDVNVRRDAARGLLLVAIRGKDAALTNEFAADAEIKFRRDLIDFRTRMLIDQETRTIRELLVAKAFDDGEDA